MTKVKEKFIYEDTEFASLDECCKFFGTTKRTIMNYSKKYNVSIPEALNIRIKRMIEDHENSIDYYCSDKDNINMREVVNLARYYNLKYLSILHIMRKTGLGVEGAVEEALKREEEKCFFVKGKLYNSIEQACNDLKISNISVYDIANNYSISAREAIQLYVYMRDKEFENSDDFFLNELFM